MPLLTSKGGAWKSTLVVDNSVVWPHELFAWIWEHHHESFVENILGGTADNIRIFWNNMPPRSGMESKVGWKDRVIPIALHGDGVAVTAVRGKSSKQVNCLSWSSCLAKGQTRFTTFLIWFAFAHLCKKVGFGCTWPVFYSKLCLSLKALWTGLWPASSMNG